MAKGEWLMANGKGRPNMAAPFSSLNSLLSTSLNSQNLTLSNNRAL